MTNPLWHLENVRLNGKSHPRLNGVTVDIAQGTTAIIGYSGAGKTSLLNLLVDFEQPDAGVVTCHVNEAETEQLPFYWVPQNGGLWPHLTVRQHLEAVAPPDSKQPIENILQAFDLAELQQALPGRLSQGEASRLALARAIATQATVLILDEPFSHIDPARIDRYRDALHSLTQPNTTSLVIATHSPATVLRDADKVICLKEGAVVYQGEPTQLYYSPPSQELALYLGPANWIEKQESETWLGAPLTEDRCLRPESVEIVEQTESSLVVEQSRFVGPVSEVLLKDHTTQNQKRFMHRSPASPLKVGQNVAIRIIAMVLACLTITGCERNNEPDLPVNSVEYRIMPADGHALPAPRGLCCGPDDTVYVLDNAGRVLVYNADGTLNRQWHMPAYDVGKPEGICRFKDGRIAVADTHYRRVVFFDDNGKVLSTMGELGEGPKQFTYPVAITQDDDENFYVGEYGGNDRVQKFSVNGDFLLEFGRTGSNPGEFQRASGVDWHQGKVFVADAFNNRVQVFDENGEFQEILGVSPDGVSLFDYPYDLTLGPKGNIFVVEYGGNRITCIDQQGKLIGRFGSAGPGQNQFTMPWGLTVNRHGTIYVADTGNRRIVELRQ